MAQASSPRSEGWWERTRVYVALAVFLLALAHIGLHDLSHDKYGHFDASAAHDCVLAHMPGTTVADPPEVTVVASFVVRIGCSLAEDILPGRPASSTSARDPPTA